MGLWNIASCRSFYCIFAWCVFIWSANLNSSSRKKRKKNKASQPAAAAPVPVPASHGQPQPHLASCLAHAWPLSTRPWLCPVGCGLSRSGHGSCPAGPGLSRPGHDSSPSGPRGQTPPPLHVWRAAWTFASHAIACVLLPRSRVVHALSACFFARVTHAVRVSFTRCSCVVTHHPRVSLNRFAIVAHVN